MLSRYTIYRRRPVDAGPLPDGIRQDTRHRFRHILRPTKEIVEAYLVDPTDAAWKTFRREYIALLKERFHSDRAPFDRLAKLATDNDVYLGCSCPTKSNPIHGRCHTYLALEFMQKKYRKLDVVVPAKTQDDESVETPSNMYARAKTWSPFKGCKFDCVYCKWSFQKQAKRQKRLCQDCYSYTPHCHEERLAKIPNKPIIFVCGNADISFCPPAFTRRIIERIVEHTRRRPHKTYYLQSKRPAYFKRFLDDLPGNVILLTTLETNRDKGYRKISKAPPPSVRYAQFKALDYPRKVVTIEPVLDFDLRTFTAWIRRIRPEYVWLGFNSRPESVTLPEPPEEKVQRLADRLMEAGIEVRGKTLRGVALAQREAQDHVLQQAESPPKLDEDEISVYFGDVLEEEKQSAASAKSLDEYFEDAFKDQS